MKTTISKKIGAAAIIAMLALPFALPVSAGASSSIFTDGFQSTPNAYSAWTSGNPESTRWSTDPAGHTGVAAKVVGNNTQSKVLSKSVSTSGYQNLSLTFWYKAQDLSNGFFGFGGDSVTVGYTTNGTTWSTLATITRAQDTNTWTSKTVSLPAGASNNANFKLRVMADLSSPSGFGRNTVTPTFWIDDVSLSGDTIATTTPVTPPATTTPPVATSTPTTSGTSTLTIITHVDNSNGTGSAVASDFAATVLETIGTSTPFAVVDSPFEGNEFGIQVVLDAGSSYAVSESTVSGYTTTLDEGCMGNVVLGTDITCSITNSDVAPAAPSTPSTTDTSGGGGGGGGGGGVISGPSSFGFVNTNPTGGVVLGTSTEADTQPLPTGCSALLGTYMRQGKTNNTAQVKALQTFLNTNLNAKLPVTGYFGSMTTEAVKNFQLAHYQEVLAPWVKFGLASDHTATGYVYKTTQHAINLASCSTLVLPEPQLP